MSKLIDLTGQKFGRLTVVKRGENAKDGRVKWLCKCDCGNPELALVYGCALRRGDTLSCGCYKRERTSECLSKVNKYDLSGEYGIGWTTNTNKEFYFDLEDYEKIKDVGWQENSSGHIKYYWSNNNKYIYLHRLIMGLQDDDDRVIDHINCNPGDNRKQNLRITSQHNNTMNRGLYKNNSSGITGVDWLKNRNKWRVRIKINGREVSGGCFEKIEDAIERRKELENLYFGEFSYENSQQINNKEDSENVC